MSDALLNVLFALLGLGFQFGVTFVLLLGACLLLDKLGMIPETEQEKALMMGIIIGSSTTKPDEKPPME